MFRLQLVFETMTTQQMSALLELGSKIETQGTMTVRDDRKIAWSFEGAVTETNLPVVHTSIVSFITSMAPKEHSYRQEFSSGAATAALIAPPSSTVVKKPSSSVKKHRPREESEDPFAAAKKQKARDDAIQVDPTNEDHLYNFHFKTCDDEKLKNIPEYAIKILESPSSRWTVHQFSTEHRQTPFTEIQKRVYSVQPEHQVDNDVNLNDLLFARSPKLYLSHVFGLPYTSAIVEQPK